VRKGYKRAKRLGRRAPFREPKSLILILCGGDVTEPSYFHGLVKKYHNAAVATKIVRGKADPIDLLNTADWHLVSEQLDEIWCVTDVNGLFTRVMEAFERVDEIAKIRLAISNPCFELWLLLHFEGRTAAVGRCRDLARAVRRYVPNYVKAVDFRLFESGVEDAIQRASALKSDEVRCPNPSTGVWELVEKITAN
jgi:hypothetical protein